MTPEEQSQMLTLVAAILYRSDTVGVNTPALAVSVASELYTAAIAQVTKTPLPSA